MEEEEIDYGRRGWPDLLRGRGPSWEEVCHRMSLYIDSTHKSRTKMKTKRRFILDLP